jgi:hypothetical protein
MNQADSMRDQGVRMSLGFEGERVKVGDLIVVASVNRQPETFEMMDSGYLAKEPVSIEVLKGTSGSADMLTVDGFPTALDLRGVRPKMRMECVIDDALRQVVHIQDCGTAWTMLTVRKAVSE